MIRVRTVACLLLLSREPVIAQRSPDERPLPGIVGVLAAFERASIVALADEHRDDVLARFRVALITDAAFPAPGRDVAIEWGNARFQRVLDRYVGGDSVPIDTLRLVWRTALGNMNGIFDSPIYEDFVVAVRNVNRSLAPERRMRLLACDPPIDWDQVRTPRDVTPFARARDQFCADVLDREVLARGRSALLIIGGGHVLRGGDSGAGRNSNVTTMLDDRHPGAVFVVTTRRSRDAEELTRGWTEPSFLRLAATALGNDATEAGPFATLADGYLFLHRGHDVEPDPAIYDRTAYRRELDRRWCITQGRPFPAAVSARTARPSITVCP
jgi:hypothetical protein